VSELSETLERLNVSGKLVVTGHSMGGIHMLSFADQFPDRVAAVVLLDTPPKGFETKRLELLSESEREARGALLASGLTNLPEAVRLEREGAASEAEWEFSGLERRIPLFVLAADSQDFGPHGSQSAHRELWVAASRGWISLSDFGHFEVAQGSDHMIHLDRRQMVVETIERAASFEN
jgi:pimeloyl-ACP methyl ester carboxylesterase